MKKLLFTSGFLIVMTLLNGCASLYMTESIPVKENYPNLLPPLAPIMDTQSLENVFGVATSTSSFSGSSSYYPLGQATISGYSSSTTYRDPAIQDLTTYFEKDATTNICQQYGTRKGYITCQVINGYSIVRTGMRWIGAYPLMGIPYLLGMPAKKAQSSLMVKIDIYDKSKNLVGSYTSDFHYDQRYVALYYGYSASDAKHKTALEAFKACMKDIKAKIRTDYDRLKKELY